MLHEFQKEDGYRLLPSAVEDALRRFLGRGLGFALLGVLAISWLSLVTWSVTDPSLTHVTREAAKNFLGYPGAVISDLMLQTLGLASAVVLFAPMFWGLDLSLSGKIASLRWKLLTYAASVLALAGAMSAVPKLIQWPLNHGYGGVVGDGVIAVAQWVVIKVMPEASDVVSGLVLVGIGIVAACFSIGIDTAQMREGVKRLYTRRGLRKPARERSEVREPQAYSDSNQPGFSRDRHSYRGSQKHWQEPRPEPGANWFPPSGGQNSGRLAAGRDEEWRDNRQIDSSEADRHRQRPALRDEPFHIRPSEENSQLQRPVSGPVQNGGPTTRGEPGPSLFGSGRLGGQKVSERPQQQPQQPGHAPSFVMAFDPDEIEERHRGVDFDVDTDIDSLKIARRFAPAGDHQRRGGLLAGMLRGAAPRGDSRPQNVPAVEPQEPEQPEEQFMPPVEHRRRPVPALRPQSTPAARQNKDNIASVQSSQNAGLVQFSGEPGSGVEAGDGAGEADRSQLVPARMRKEVLKRPLASPRMPLRTASGYQRPSLNLLTGGAAQRPGPEMTQAVLRGTARLLQDVLERFGVDGEISEIRPGPVVTVFQVTPAAGTNPARVTGLADDIAKAMSVSSARVVATSGSSSIGIELPNVHREQIGLRDILSSESYRSFGGSLPIVLGRSLGGQPIVADLGGLSNILIGGKESTGKSTCLKAMILSLIFRHGPEDCRFLMIDPKFLELGAFNRIPHLMCPVISEQDKAVAALDWIVTEMDERAKRMAKLSARTLDVFNNRVRNARKRGEMIARTVQTGFDEKTGQPIYEHEQMEFDTLPHIVIAIDELAELMDGAGPQIEDAVSRIAEKGRAVGIYLVAGTKTMTKLCVTDRLKSAFKSGIAFKFRSKLDSRRLVGDQGAEQLLEFGDMVLATQNAQSVRIHGVLTSDEDVEAVAQNLCENGRPRYAPSLMSKIEPADFVESEADEPTQPSPKA